MELNPFQLAGAFVAACIVLGLARLNQSLEVPRRYSVRSLLITMTVAALVFGVVSVVLRQ